MRSLCGGLNTYETQDTIVSMVGGRTRFGDEWGQIGDSYTASPEQNGDDDLFVLIDDGLEPGM